MLIGAWALWSMFRFSVLRVRPEPSDHAVLLTEGPYRTIRHPMYTALILAMGGVMLNRFVVEGVIAYLVLVVVLVLKIRYEERLLLERFPAYAEYMKRTWRIAPRFW
jgi:protein-S-isoprenylcysteine O-methyltransferase Ste14